MALSNRRLAVGDGPGGEKHLDGIRVQRTGEEIALPTVALLALELGALLCLLDPLGQGLETEGLAQLDQVRTSAPDSGESAMVEMKERSILRVSTGNCWR